MRRFSVISLMAASAALISSQVLAAIYKTSHQLSGFSTDSRYYIYLESYRNAATDVPKAKLQIINLPRNACIENGCLETEYTDEARETAPSLTTKSAENQLLKKTSVIRYNLKLNRPAPGRKLPVLSRKTNADGSETYTFILNDKKEKLEVLMQQKYIPSVAYGGNAEVDRAALRLEVTANYRKRTLSTLNNYRENAMKYTLREVRLAPDGRTVAIIMNMMQPNEQGALQTTLVQSSPL